MKEIVVFSDGETWEDVDGVSLVEVPDYIYTKLVEEGAKPKFYCLPSVPLGTSVPLRKMSEALRHFKALSVLIKELGSK